MKYYKNEDGKNDNVENSKRRVLRAVNVYCDYSVILLFQDVLKMRDAAKWFNDFSWLMSGGAKQIDKWAKEGVLEEKIKEQEKINAATNGFGLFMKEVINKNID